MDEDESVSSSTFSPSSPERGLALGLKRQILQDIDELGGLREDLSIDFLLVKKPDIYGTTTTHQGRQKRRQLQNLVGSWKRHLSRGTFDKVRHRLNRQVSVQSPPYSSTPPTPPVEVEITRQPQIAQSLPKRPSLSPPSQKMSKYAGKLIDLFPLLFSCHLTQSLFQLLSRSTAPRFRSRNCSPTSWSSVSWMT